MPYYTILGEQAQLHQLHEELIEELAEASRNYKMPKNHVLFMGYGGQKKISFPC